ncbi:MAG: hypothetical protein LH606_01255 [Cytophagaceae bacterium]|nr:hypothetical protein [Cytophagaceae bacterium]
MTTFDVNGWMERSDRAIDASELATISLELVTYLNSLPEEERASVRQTMQRQLNARFGALDEKLIQLENSYGQVGA